MFTKTEDLFVTEQAKDSSPITAEQLANWIRLGSAKTHPCVYAFYRKIGFSTDIASTCAMGAAMVGAGVDVTDSYERQRFITKLCLQFKNFSPSQIALMNDNGISREEIADWIQSNLH